MPLHALLRAVGVLVVIVFALLVPDHAHHTFICRPDRPSGMDYQMVPAAPRVITPRYLERAYRLKKIARARK